ncbi:hypothetical protein MTO96_033465 [Rhipicephalus appendiculatus]
MCFCHQVELKRLIVGHGEDMGVLPDGHFDAVVLLFVLCSAKDGSKLLSECKRVLKKGRWRSCLGPRGGKSFVVGTGGLGFGTVRRRGSGVLALHEPVPDGRLLFAEHVAHKKGTLSRFIQDALTPLTKKFACGCHVNRESGVVLSNAGFSSLDVNTVYINVPVMFSHNIYGVATA